MTFVRRRLTIRFQLGDDGAAFDASGNNTFEISGIRASANISKAGGVSMAQLSLTAYGLPLSVMNKLTLLGKPLVDGRNNTVTVSAGDDESGLAVVFQGTISEAWVDARNAPQVALVVSAFSGLVTALKPTPPVSFRGSIDASLAASGIAQQAGLVFENSGVSTRISDPYLTGTALQQLQQLAQAGKFDYTIDDGTLAIWPKGGSRKGASVLISPETGLIGYPMRTENGVEVQTLFNPAIVFCSQIQIKSSLTPANGDWTVFRLSHDLESETPNGKWFTTMECSILGQDLPVVG